MGYKSKQNKIRRKKNKIRIALLNLIINVAIFDGAVKT